MKKQIVITLITTALLFATGLTQAKSSHGGHHGNGHHGSGHNGSRHYGNRHNGNRHRSYGHRNYGQRSYGRHSYGHYGYGRHSYGYNSGLGYVAGALALSSIVYAIDRNQYRESAYLARPVASAQEYWYRVDTDGRCVQITLNQYAQEVWTTVDSSYCY